MKCLLSNSIFVVPIISYGIHILSYPFADHIIIIVSYYVYFSHHDHTISWQTSKVQESINSNRTAITVIAVTITMEAEGSQEEQQYDALTLFHSQSLQLRRLLHCMAISVSPHTTSPSTKFDNDDTYADDTKRKRNTDTYTDTDTGGNCQATNKRVPDRIFFEQMTDAHSKLGEIKMIGDSIIQMSMSMSTSASTSTGYANINGDVNLDPETNATIADTSEMLEYLEASVATSCQMINHFLAERSAGNSVHVNDNDKDKDKDKDKDYHASKQMINHIFFDDIEDDSDFNDDMNDLDDFSVISSNNDNANDNGTGADGQREVTETQSRTNTHNRDANTRAGATPQKKKTPQDIQKEQEQMLEEEIAQMATQLKQSSLSIKTTLASQNNNLEEMETMAQANLDKTKDVTDKVAEQVRATGWRKSAGRWFTFFIVLGTWVFCFLTIRVVPKRTGACLFFCKRDETKGGRDDREHEYKHGYQYERGHGHEYGHGHDQKDGAKKVDVKHSYCEETDQEGEGGAGKLCTRPLEPNHHAKRMERSTEIDDEDPEDVAFSLAEENKDKRFESNLERAKKEQDEIASSRVRDGWDSPDEYHDDGDDVGDYTENDLDQATEDKDIDKNEEIVKQNPEIVDDYYSEKCGYYNYDDDDAFDESIEYDFNDLKEAIKNQHLNKVKKILEQNPDFTDDYYDKDQDENEIENESESENDDEDDGVQYKRTDLKSAIFANDDTLMKKIIKKNPEFVLESDENGWSSIHEAVRKGSVSSTSILIRLGGADLNAQIGRTGQGGNSLWLANSVHPPTHDIVKFLIDLGASEIGPTQIRNDEL